MQLSRKTKLNDNKKVIVYQRIKKKNVFLNKESIVHPLLEFEPNYNKKEDLFFLNNNRFIEVINCVQVTAMGSLF